MHVEVTYGVKAPTGVLLTFILYSVTDLFVRSFLYIVIEHYLVIVINIILKHTDISKICTVQVYTKF